MRPWETEPMDDQLSRIAAPLGITAADVNQKSGFAMTDRTTP